MAVGRRCPGALNALVRERQIDLIHAFESLPTLEAACGPHLWMGTPVLSTVYSIEVPPYMPRDLPMIVGYTKEFDIERGRGRSRVYTVVCPVDTEANAPVADSSPARKRFGLRDDDLAAVVVGRLTLTSSARACCRRLRPSAWSIQR